MFFYVYSFIILLYDYSIMILKRRGFNMSEIKDETIRKRLTVSFAKNTIFTSVIAIVVLIVMIIISILYSNTLDNYGYAQGDVGRAMTYFAETRSATRAVIGYRNSDAVAKCQEYHDDYKAKFEDVFGEVEEMLSSDEEIAEYNAIKGKLSDYWTLDQQIIDLGSTSNTADSEEAQSLAISQLSTKYTEINDMLDNLMTIKVTKGNSVENVLRIVVLALSIASVALIILAMMVSYKSGKSLATKISESLRRLSDRMTSFAQGDLSSEFPTFDMKDEINDTAQTAADMAENIRELINDMDSTLSDIAAGDFTVKCSCPERYVGEFKALRKSVANLETKMRDTLMQIDETSQKVDVGSAQLSENANALAQGAVDQAGAVKQLTTTITDMSSHAKESATRIEQAYKKGLFYKDKAEEGREEVAHLVTEMEAISKVSNEIKDIIGEIEDIASQTNLLSLNASIEAARAGEAGKGFAVVADQIGKLAADSAESAVRTRELIQKALDEVDKGNATMVKTNDTLQQVVEGIEYLSNVTKDASDTSYTQASTMDQVEKGIEQISAVVESNSSSAEETSATGEELAIQATSLKELTQQFVLR
jgi:methyl-accepting chemotaxis protein